MKAHVVPCGPAVNESERKAIAQLKTRIISAPGDDEWWLLTNLAFSATHRLQSDEIDIIAIGPPGVRVIEVKHWTAAWVNRNPGLVEQEADRVTGKARKIGTTLRRLVPGLPHVDGVFLVTETAPRVRGLDGREPVRGVAFHTFNTWRGAAGLDAPNALSVQQIREMGRFLSPRNAVAPDGALKRLAGYTRLQLRTPPDEGFHRIYGATPASRQDRVMLHLYDRPTTPRRRRRRLNGSGSRCSDCNSMDGRRASSIRFRTRRDTSTRSGSSPSPIPPRLPSRSEPHDAWDSSARLSFARNALAALRDLHTALSTIFEVASEWQDNSFEESCSTFRAIRRAKLARVPRFYADKALRHRLSAERHQALTAEIDRMIERG